MKKNEVAVENDINGSPDLNQDTVNSNEDKSTEKSSDTNISSKSIVVYKNGDRYFPGKKIVINKRYIRTWDSFLEDITQSLKPRTGAIRDIRTPHHGTRVRSLDDLISNGRYVAVPNGENIKLIDYNQTIDVNHPLPRTRMNNRRRLKPIRPSNHDDVEKIENKILQPGTYSIVIHIYRNGDPFTRPINVVLRPIEQTHMSILARAIEDRVLLQGNKPIRRLYTMIGEKIKYAKDVKNGEFYVAASNELFIDIEYGHVLPVIRGGKVASKYRRIKYLSQRLTPKQSHRSEEGNQEEQPVTTRTIRTDRSVERTRLVTGQPAEKKQKKSNYTEENAREEAAAKIQAYFRGYQFRCDLVESKNNQKSPPKSRYVQLTARPRKAKLKNTAGKPKPKDQRENEEEEEAAVKIQSNFRGYKSRQEPDPQEKTPRRTTSNSRPEQKSQKNEPPKKEEKRKPVQKKPVEKKKNTENYDVERELAAIKIQAGFRGYRSRRNLPKEEPIKVDSKPKPEEQKKQPKTKKEPEKKKEAEKKQEQKEEEDPRNNEEREKAASCIQAGLRGYKARKNGTERNQAATRIQASFRGYKARQGVEDRNQAATRIQAGFRGYKARQGVEDRNRAATRIQASFRGYKARHGVEDRNQAATRIQASFRGHKTRKDLEERKQAAIRIQAGFRGYRARQGKDDQIEAAKKIQAGYRGHRSRKSMSERKEAATKIQAGYRGFRSRRNMEKKKKSLSAEEQVQERNRAACRIQAGFRGHQVRSKKAASEGVETS